VQKFDIIRNKERMKAHLLVSCAHVDLFEPVELVENAQTATAIQIFNHFLPIKKKLMASFISNG
jgi:hypothetical protein